MSTTDPRDAEDSSLPAWLLPSRLEQALSSRPTVKRVLENASWLVIERLALLGTTFIVNVLFVRYLGPDRFGLYSFALSFAGLFSTVAALGMELVVVRELTRQPDREGEILGTTVWLRAAAGAVAWAAASLAIWRLRGDGTTRELVAILAATGVFAAPGVFEYWFHARMSLRRLALARGAVTLGAQGARCVLLAFAASLPLFAVVHVATAALTSLAVWRAWVARRGEGVVLRGRLSAARELLRDSWPQLVAGLSIVVYMKVDQVMIAWIVGDRENGIYATAATLSELWYFLPIAIGTSVYPLIVKAREAHDSERLDRQLGAFYDGMVALGWAVAVPIVLLAGPLVRLLYGPVFAEAAPVLRVHVLSFVFVCIGVARGRFLIAENLVRFNMASTVLGAVVNVALNLALIPPFGALGAAWATLASYATSNYLSGFLHPAVRRQTRLLTLALAVPFRPGAIRRLVVR